MKTVIITLCLLTSNLLLSQTVVHSYAISAGSWSETDDDFIYQDWVETDHEILLEGFFVYINDTNKSTYRTYGDPMELDDFMIWNAYDKEGKECVFLMSRDYIVITYVNNFTITYATSD